MKKLHITLQSENEKQLCYKLMEQVLALVTESEGTLIEFRQEEVNVGEKAEIQVPVFNRKGESICPVVLR